MQKVKLSSLQPGDAFIAPWRNPEIAVGEIRDIGKGSVGVHVPVLEGEGWEDTRWALGTMVVPTTRDRLNGQSIGTRNRNRSKTDSPVERVHAICDELLAIAQQRKQPLKRDDVIAKCLEEGINVNTAKTQFYAWRKKS